MSKKTLHLTTTLVASFALGFPQSSLGQDAQTNGIEMVCLDGAEPPCPEGEPINGMPASAQDHVPAQTPELSEEPLPAGEPEAAGSSDTSLDATGDIAVDGEATVTVDPATDAESGAAPDAMADPEGDASAEGDDASMPADIDPDAPDTTGDMDAEAEATVNPEDNTDDGTAASEAPLDPAEEEADPLDVDPVEEADADAQGNAPAEDNAPVAASAAGTDAEPADVTEDTIGADDTRSSDEEFDTPIDGSVVATGEAATTGEEADDADTGLTRLEQVLLLGIGAVAVGSLLDDGSEVVSNSGDRVVVERDGQYVVYKDDDALLFEDGMTVRTENFADGSTRTFLSREDGSQIVTIRDPEGRVLRRTQIAADGTEVQLFDDTVQAQAIDASRLATYRTVDGIAFSSADKAALRAALLAETEADRRFSLRQIREYQEVRSLVPSIDLDTINFATGAASIAPAEIESLIGVGNTMAEILAANPREVFLIEGHTDAIGDAATNLALSDRRAETVALALTEYFAIPPENLVVQGYGERFLKVDTERATQENRRATVRRITSLLQTAAAN